MTIYASQKNNRYINMTSPYEEFNRAKKERWKLFEDIPIWETTSIIKWIKSAVYVSKENGWGATVIVYDPNVLASIQRKERLMFHEIDLNISDWESLYRDIQRHIASDDQKNVILLIELLVKKIRDSETPSNSYIHFNGNSTKIELVLTYLDMMLNNGSKWKVNFQKNAESGLILRVEKHLTQIVEDSENQTLKEAWEFAFGTKPQPDRAIEKAQSAIEQIASNKQLTTATTKVYGTIIGDLKVRLSKSYINGADKEYQLTSSLSGLPNLGNLHPNDQYVKWISDGLHLIQQSNPTRHKSKAIEGFEVSVSAAQQSVIMATAIYELINRQLITRKP
jgi:hypothetical protein